MCFHKKEIYDLEEHFGITHAKPNRYYYLFSQFLSSSARINLKILCKKPLEGREEDWESERKKWLQLLSSFVSPVSIALSEWLSWKRTLNSARRDFSFVSSSRGRRCGHNVDDTRLNLHFKIFVTRSGIKVLWLIYFYHNRATMSPAQCSLNKLNSHCLGLTKQILHIPIPKDQQCNLQYERYFIHSLTLFSFHLPLLCETSEETHPPVDT